MTEILPFLMAGFGLGVLHSFEPDHLAAMTTLAGRRHRSHFVDFANGALWGLGHTLALGSFGAVLLVVGAQPPGWVERLLEIGVAMVLVALGIARLRSVRWGLHRHRHGHNGIAHDHYHVHLGKSGRHGAREHLGHSHAPVWIGMLHGFAGTGAVLVLAPPLIVTTGQYYLFYVLAFGLGSILSMGAYCGGLGSLATGLQRSFWSVTYRFATVTGALSIAVGVTWLWRAVAY